jgi:hypothetical protein
MLPAVSEIIPVHVARSAGRGRDTKRYEKIKFALLIITLYC